jgi:hypothetical protein
MKNVLFLFVIAIGICGNLSCQNENKSAKKNISFYEVPLVCGAAPKIGCGSRSKPALLEFEKHPAIAEAWLNRSGTVIAIVWKDSEQTDNVARPIFDKNEITFKELSEKASRQFSNTFKKPDVWFGSADVDALSRE